MNAPAADTGLLSPVRAGTPVERLVDDAAWLQAMADAEAALARAQAGLGVLPRAAADLITEVVREGAPDPRVIAVASREHANPVVSLVSELTRRVAARDPAAAEHVHRGSTSQDIFDTGAMLVCRRALEAVRADLAAAAEAFAVTARAHRDTPAAARTLALHAVPTTFGLRVAGWRSLVLDAVERIDRVLDGGLPVSLGGSAGTLGGYLAYAAPEHQEDPGAFCDALVRGFARETGLAPQRLPWHALRTPVADVASVLGFAAAALGKVAVDVLTLSRTEVGEVAEPSPAGRGASSAMPHKRNPVLATMVRTAALQVPVLTAGVLQCLSAEDERSPGAWHAEWQPLRECLRLTGGAAHTMVELARGLAADPVRMRANLALTGGAATSERVAAALTPRLGRPRARAVLDACSAEAAASGRPLADVLAEHPALEGAAGPDALAALCDPVRYTGAAARLVDRALDRRPREAG
ncbi:lyase family protein [Nocardiopsis sp. NPDC006139]|uniref:lyase family protein n=1 Tax=Nocardiopsis sp. NPDC006139 TaxID=3154578 RepID=UPI00339E13DF